MTLKKISLKDKIKELKGSKTREIKLVEENSKTVLVKETILPIKVDRRHLTKSGGRPKGGEAEKNRVIKQLIAQHGEEVVPLRVKIPGTKKFEIIIKSRALHALEALYRIGVEKDNDMALDRYLNRIAGKPVQPIEGGDAPIKLEHSAGRILDKAYGDDEE